MYIFLLLQSTVSFFTVYIFCHLEYIKLAEKIAFSNTLQQHCTPLCQAEFAGGVQGAIIELRLSFSQLLSSVITITVAMTQIHPGFLKLVSMNKKIH